MGVKLEFLVFLGNEESEAGNHAQARSRTGLLGASSLGGLGDGTGAGCWGGAQGQNEEWVAGRQNWTQSRPGLIYL